MPTMECLCINTRLNLVVQPVKPSVSLCQSPLAINFNLKLIMCSTSIITPFLSHLHGWMPLLFCSRHLLPTYKGGNFLALWLIASAFLTNLVRSVSLFNFHASFHMNRIAEWENLPSLFKKPKPYRCCHLYLISVGNTLKSLSGVFLNWSIALRNLSLSRLPDLVTS